MKKLLAFIIFSVALVSCYEDYILDYTYTGIYFPYQIDVRTFVVGEGMKIQVGAALGGVRENTKDRNVTFALDNSLITPALLTKMKGAAAYIKDATTPVAALLPMPSNYYTLSNPNTMVIKKGQHMGAITVTCDSVNFLTDSVNTVYSTYVLPFRITAADCDTIIEPKRTNVIGLKFEQKLYGNYWHGGKARIERPGLPDSIYAYRTQIPTAETKIWPLITKGPKTLHSKGYLDQVSTKQEMQLVLQPDNTIKISSVAGSTFTYTADGECKFNNSLLLQDRRIYLQYKYTNTVSGWTYHCTDTLRFRNRVRDGILEWQDENPSHYTK
jgi:hypothetical protein